MKIELRWIYLILDYLELLHDSLSESPVAPGRTQIMKYIF